MSVIFECRLCEEGNERGKKIERPTFETVSVAKLHLKEKHLGQDYTAELDKAIGTIPGKELDYMHIDYADGWQTSSTHEFYLPDGRVWVNRYRHSGSSKYSGSPS
jgi:hypothetical protein